MQKKKKKKLKLWIRIRKLNIIFSHIKDINSLLPHGSNVTVEFPFNGYGVTEAGGYQNDLLFKKVIFILFLFI